MDSTRHSQLAIFSSRNGIGQAIGIAFTSIGDRNCVRPSVKIFSQLYSRTSRLPHNPAIALAGTWCAPGIREGGGDLPPWYECHGPEGAATGRHARRVGDRRSSLPCGGGRRSTVRPGPLEYLVADRTCARPNAATDTGRGRRPKAFRRLMPRDQAGSMNHPIIKLDWWSRPSRLPDFLSSPERRSRVGQRVMGKETNGQMRKHAWR